MTRREYQQASNQSMRRLVPSHNHDQWVMSSYALNNDDYSAHKLCNLRTSQHIIRRICPLTAGYTIELAAIRGRERGAPSRQPRSLPDRPLELKGGRLRGTDQLRNRQHPQRRLH